MKIPPNQPRTDDEELDKILDSIQDYTVESALGGSPFNTQEENKAYIEKVYDEGRAKAKAAITAYCNRLGETIAGV